METNTRYSALFSRLLMLVFCFLLFGKAYGQTATTTVTNISITVNDNTPLLFGITFDARTSLTGYPNFGQVGYYNADGTIIPEIGAIFNDFPMSTLRYPANAVSFGFDWKKSIGPIASRPDQDLLGALGGPQPMNFGFDEFMTMTAAKGVSPADVQIMIPIYDSTTSWLTTVQADGAIGDPAGFNADWVEYCNAPNDGSNPGGGIDWAAQRSANGHDAPYGIKIWNIGNEPWSPVEFGNDSAGFNKYIAYVSPIINAMLAIDPTLHITLPTTGNPTSQTSWASALLNSSLVAQHKIFGVSQHYFLNESVVNGSIPYGVASAKNNLTAEVNVSLTKGVKVLIGDYAHSITNYNSAAMRNLAMQWEGANLEADFLLMISQMNNIDRVNFWAYGLPYGTWAPIRINSIGNYTLMPAAAIYKKLAPAFLNKSLAVTTSSPAASDGNAYAVRSGAFISSDATLLNFVAVNRDRLNTVLYQPGSVAGYTLSNVRLLTADSLQAETFYETNMTADISGNYSMPALSILILEYSNITTSVEQYKGNKITIYPNPANDIITINTDNTSLGEAEVTIYSLSGQNIRREFLKPDDRDLNVAELAGGTYIVSVKQGPETQYCRLIISR